MYEVRDTLGQGKFGDVKRVVDKRTRMVYAMKERSYETENQRLRTQEEIEVSDT